MEKKTKISIVMPTIEEEGVFKLVKDIRRLLGNDVEIIIVDKSSDNYYKKLLKTGTTVIRQGNRGVENAIMIGLRKAHGDILGSIDADDTHGIEGLKRGVVLIERGDANMVLGNRFDGLQEGSMSFYIKMGNVLLSSLFSLLYRTRVRDVLTGLFVMDRKSFEWIKDIKPYRAGIAFFVIEVAKRGGVVKEVGIKYYKRRYGESKITKSKLGFGANIASNFIAHALKK